MAIVKTLHKYLIWAICNFIWPLKNKYIYSKSSRFCFHMIYANFIFIFNWYLHKHIWLSFNIMHEAARHCLVSITCMELQSNALSWFTEISRTIVLISLCCSIHRGQQAVSFPGRKGIPRTLVVNRDEHPTNGLTRELFFICSAYITQVYQPNSLESNFPFLYKVNQESSSSQGHFFIFDNGKR